MFADIIKVGLHVVFSPNKIIKTIKNYSSNNLILINTTKKSQQNNKHINNLKKLLNTFSPNKIHLIINTTTKNSNLYNIINHYHIFNINHLIFTKLDETVKLGNIFNIINKSTIPISYFTFKQNIPNNIKLTHPSKYIQQI